MSERFRCFGDHLSLYVDYHDNEWGRSVHNDRKLFEMLILGSNLLTADNLF